MIERNDFMANKDFSIKELEEKCNELGNQYEDMMRILKERKQEEEIKKQAELAAEKEARKKEVTEARDNFQKLLKAYIKDYGSISINTDANEWPPFFSSKPWHWWF